MKELLRQASDLLGIPFLDDVIIELVDSISEYVSKDDINYYTERKETIDIANGLFYSRKDGKNVILIRNVDLVNLVATLIHEYVHLIDYTMLSIERRNENFRELQEDYIFLFWTEYHATYYSYKFLFALVVSVNRRKVDGGERIKNKKQYS